MGTRLLSSFSSSFLFFSFSVFSTTLSSPVCSVCQVGFPQDHPTRPAFQERAKEGLWTRRPSFPSLCRCFGERQQPSFPLSLSHQSHSPSSAIVPAPCYLYFCSFCNFFSLSASSCCPSPSSCSLFCNNKNQK